MHFSKIYNQPVNLPIDGRTLLVGASSLAEKRSEWWKELDTSKTNIHILEEDDSSARLVDKSNGSTASLLSRAEVRSLLTSLAGDNKCLTIDITNFSHNAWAPLIRSATNDGFDVNVTYIEPREYASPNRDAALSPYNLSEKINGIAPIAGFAHLSDEYEKQYILTVFLGFEGARFGNILHEVDPDDDQVFPVIGVPGFRPEFVDYAYDGNRAQLQRLQATSRIRYSSAYCPFMTIDVLQKIAEDEKPRLMKIAPIGTKPQALGGLLFALSGEHQVEFVYDHPVRKAGRSTGIGRCHNYLISNYLKS